MCFTCRMDCGACHMASFEMKTFIACVANVVFPSWFYFQCYKSHCLIRKYSFLAGSPESITNCVRESHTVAKSFVQTLKLMPVVTCSASSSWISSDSSSPAPLLK